MRVRVCSNIYFSRTLPEVKSFELCVVEQKRNAGYPGSSMICLSKMAARGTGFPPLYTMGFWDKEHHMRLFVKCNLTCTGVFMKALLLLYNILIRCCIRL